MTMKKFASGCVAVLATALLAGCGSSGDTASAPSSAATGPVPVTHGGKLTYVSYGGPFQENQGKAWLSPFTAANGTTFANDGPSDPAKIRAMVEGGKTTWDVVDIGPFFAREACGKYLEKLNLSGVDVSQFPEGTVKECGVPAERYALLLVYNTNKYGANPPTKLADFFDTSTFAGKRTVVTDLAGGLLEAALLSDGVPGNKLYPLDVDRALKVYGKIKKDTTFATTNGQQAQLLTDGQADMGLIVTARAISAARAGAKIKPVFDQTVSNVNMLVVPKGSPNKDLATNFIAFASQPAQSAKFAELSGTAPANVQARPQYDAVGQQFDAFAQGRPAPLQLDLNWWADNFNATQQKFTLWLAG